MNHYGPKELADAFRTVRSNTILIAEDIPESRYAFKATSDVRSVAELLAHVAVAPRWPMDVHGRRVSSIDVQMFVAHREQSAREEQALATKADILAALKDGGEAFARFLESLDDRALAETVSFSPPAQPANRTRFEMLLGTKEHEMHHRGQLMLIERLLGIVPHLTRMRQARLQAIRT